MQSTITNKRVTKVINIHFVYLWIAQFTAKIKFYANNLKIQVKYTSDTLNTFSNITWLT